MEVCPICGGARRIRRKIDRRWWEVLFQRPAMTDDLCPRCVGAGVVPSSPEEESSLKERARHNADAFSQHVQRMYLRQPSSPQPVSGTARKPAKLARDPNGIYCPNPKCGVQLRSLRDVWEKHNPEWQAETWWVCNSCHATLMPDQVSRLPKA